MVQGRHRGKSIGCTHFGHILEWLVAGPDSLPPQGPQQD
jgi:hypothetical protein